MTIKNRKKWFPFLILALSILLIIVAGYSAMLIKQGLHIYNDMKSPLLAPLRNIGITTTPLVQIDKELGNVPRPNAAGSFLIPEGQPIPFYNGPEGFRSLPSEKQDLQTRKHPRLLFLGDSFIYGSLVNADTTFPEKTAKYLGGESINAGVPGYSLAQMLLYARRLTPKYKPDFIVVQYSPWLVLRSEAGAITDSSSKLTLAPYFFKKSGVMGIATAPFTPPPSTMRSIEKYKGTPKSLTDALSFFTTVGIPFYFHHTYNATLLRIRQFAGLTPKKSTDSIGIIRFAYQEFDKIAKENNAKLVIVPLGTAISLHVPYDLFPEDAIVVNAWESQVEKLTDPSSWGYVKQYFLWRGNPPIPVDWHPNETAHNITALALSDALRQQETRYLRKGTHLTPVSFQECLSWLPPELSNPQKIISSITLPVFRKNHPITIDCP